MDVLDVFGRPSNRIYGNLLYTCVFFFFKLVYTNYYAATFDYYIHFIMRFRVCIDLDLWYTAVGLCR